MSMTPFALAIVGLDSSSGVLDERARQQRLPGSVEDAVPNPLLPPMPDMAPPREKRRVTSHYNHFQTSCNPITTPPPSYAVSQAGAGKWATPQRRYLDRGHEVLPKYACTVAMEGTMLLQIEADNPLHSSQEQDWREVYVVLRGTSLCMHRVKGGSAGKLWRQYTLQHAEIGSASDVQHTILVPQSRLANLIPSSRRWKTWRKDPDLFKPVRQSILRLRVETDQLLLANSSEDGIARWINAVAAGIDIAPPIDERNVPRICTVPRRRRRQRPRLQGDLTDGRLIEEQEQILREFYPAFAQQSSDNAASTTPITLRSAQQEASQTAEQQDDDLDLAVMAEDSSTSVSHSAHLTPSSSSASDSSLRPAVSRQTTASTINSIYSSDMTHATSAANFDSDGKWAPPHPRTQAQQQRYIRRCMPTLLMDAPRASDILISNGQRVRINWRMELLEAWQLQPPTYKAHNFDTEGMQLRRTVSQSSASGSVTTVTPQSSSSMLGTHSGVGEVTPVESGLAQLSLQKTASGHGSKTMSVVPAQSTPDTPAIKVDEARGAEVHGLVYCF